MKQLEISASRCVGILTFTADQMQSGCQCMCWSTINIQRNNDWGGIMNGTLLSNYFEVVCYQVMNNINLQLCPWEGGGLLLQDSYLLSLLSDGLTPYILICA